MFDIPHREDFIFAKVALRKIRYVLADTEDISQHIVYSYRKSWMGCCLGVVSSACLLPETLRKLKKISSLRAWLATWHIFGLSGWLSIVFSRSWSGQEHKFLELTRN